ELHGFFPELLGSIFGYDNNNDWGLKCVLQSRAGTYNQLRVFLGPLGPIFNLINKLQVDGHLKYEFFIKCLPLPTQNSLSEGNIPLLYHNKIQISNISSNSSRVVLLNAFEYYMFHFAYYVIYQQNSKTSQDSNWMNDSTFVYLAILEDYLNHFLPTSTLLYQSTTGTSHPCPPNRQQTSWFGTLNRVPQSQTQFTGLIRTSPSGHIPLAMKGHSAYDHSSGDIWRSETFIQILIEFWLNQNTMDSVTRNVLSHGQVYFMPSVDLVRAVRMLIKQIHTFVYSSGIEALSHPALSPLDELKRSIIPQMLQKKFYCFLRHGFAHWPLDPSFRVIVETWLSFIQPWRYANNPTLSKSESSAVYTAEWSSFVHDTFPFFSVIVQEFVLRALKLDFYSSKDVFILLRVTKNICILFKLIYLWEVSTYGRCPPMGGVHLWEVSTYGRCPPMGGVHLWEVSTYGRCPLMGGVHLWEGVYTYGRCPLMGGVHLWEGVYTYGRCPLMGGVHLWEESTYGRCPLMGGVLLWEVSTYGRCPLMGGVHLWEVFTYGRCPLMGGYKSEKLLSESPKGAVRGTPPVVGVSIGSSIRANYLDLEGPSYTYILKEKLARLLSNVSSALTSLKRPPTGTPGQSSQTGAQASIGWLKTLFSGDFLDDDCNRNRDTDKVVSYLDQSYKNLTSIAKVNCDVTDTGEQTLPWATPSAVRERLSPSITSSTMTHGYIPECIQTDRGLILTERGKYQVIVRVCRSSLGFPVARTEEIGNEGCREDLVSSTIFPMMNGLRRFEVHYSGDPELQPIRSYENPTLVRMLYRLSSYFNYKIGGRLHDMYTTPGYLSCIACALSPCLKRASPASISHDTPRASPASITHDTPRASPASITHDTPRASPASITQSTRYIDNPRISLRFLASYKTMVYFILFYLLCKIFSLGSLTILVLFILVLFFSVLGNVCPVHRKNDEVQKKLF
ncbi:hypothetical protein QZH41_013252, partial [Actinostola sp. cb2023]